VVEGIRGRVLAGLQVFVGVQVIDHLVEGVDLPRVQVGTAVRIPKGGRLKGQALHVHGDLGVADGADDAQPTADNLPCRTRLALVVAEGVDDHPRPLLEAQVPHLLAAHRCAVHIGQHEHAQVRAVAPVVPLAAHHRGLASLRPQLGRL
jgi:hypothetical protein